MTDNVVHLFKSKEPKKRKSIDIRDVETIGFLNKQDRELWISNPEDIKKIMRFILQEKIQIFEDKD